jgi:hypothetical protein
MTKFVYLYTGGGMPESDADGKQLMKAWEGFLGGIGEQLVDVGAPFGRSSSLNGNGVLGVTGYSIVDAASLEEAASLANGCPVFDRGGNVEVYEALEL